MTNFSWRVPTLVEFGEGVSKKVGTEAPKLVKEAQPRAMIVTDPGILQAGLLEGVLNPTQGTRPSTARLRYSTKKELTS